VFPSSALGLQSVGGCSQLAPCAATCPRSGVRALQCLCWWIPVFHQRCRILHAVLPPALCPSRTASRGRDMFCQTLLPPISLCPGERKTWVTGCRFWCGRMFTSIHSPARLIFVPHNSDFRHNKAGGRNPQVKPRPLRESDRWAWAGRTAKYLTPSYALPRACVLCCTIMRGSDQLNAVVSYGQSAMCSTFQSTSLPISVCSARPVIS
jgi:hypothetical protein